MRAVGLAAALALAAAGGVGLLLGRGPEQPALNPLRARAAVWLANAGAPRLLKGPLPPSLLVAAGLVAAATVLGTRRRRPEPEKGPSEPEGIDRRLQRKVLRQAQSLARKGQVHDAAEICFANGLLERAAELFVEAGDWVRAAEIRHDQNRFAEAAELYLKADDPEAAGAIFAAHQEFERAGECYAAAGRHTVAGEMFERGHRFRRAAESYRRAGFPLQAAQAFIRCQEWEAAAETLEEVLREEQQSVGVADPKRDRELRKLALQCGKLYEEAGRLEKAEEVLERGGCPGAAAEIALRSQRFARAAELFLAAHQPARAAEVLRQFGEHQEAARILGEHHRGRGEDAEAARFLEEAGDFLAAADLLRSLETFAPAAENYERAGDRLQAAEMHRAAGAFGRAAENLEAAGHWEEAAECHGAAGDALRQAGALARAGRHRAAGELYHASGRDDEAIKVLQRVSPESADFPRAAALLGEIFRGRGETSLAEKKLRQAIGKRELSRDNLGLFYALATVCEANGELREAVDLYEKILACDYHFEDVEARLSAAKARLSAGASGEGGAEGTHAGRYRILSELGRGGMGIVYKAKDTVLDRLVAYKVLPDSLRENPQALRNFLREAKSAAQLNHPNIVTVYDAGQQDGRTYIAMEFVDGNTLKEIVRRRGAIAPGGVLHVMVQMCEALAYAHEKRIVHRDIKTANTMWTRDRKAKIMDFGLAKVVEEVRNHTTFVSGTPYYMSPEQTLGRNVDHRTDLYSLGVTLFELATGRLPFIEGNVPYHHVHTAAPDPREVNPALPALLAEVIARCLRKDPDERFQSAREILATVRSRMPQTTGGASGGPASA